MSENVLTQNRVEMSEGVLTHREEGRDEGVLTQREEGGDEGVLTQREEGRDEGVCVRSPQVDPSIRSMMALQQERGSTSFSELQSEVTRRTTTQMMDSKPALLKWSRVPGQVWSDNNIDICNQIRPIEATC